jgi:hypothetical protein
MQITTIGLDLAKHVFQVHGVDALGDGIEKRRLRRGQVLAYFGKLAPCLVGMEACATAHFWARELRRLGHDVRLLPPQYVKPYVRRGKNDAADAAAICEAVSRPSMRFVPIKSEEQQSLLVIHRARDLLVRQRTQLINAIRGHLAEFGLIGAQGVPKVARLLDDMREDVNPGRRPRRHQLGALEQRIDLLEARIAACTPCPAPAWPDTRVRPPGHARAHGGPEAASSKLRADSRAAWTCRTPKTPARLWPCGVITGSLPGRGRSSRAASAPEATARSTQRWTV